MTLAVNKLHLTESLTRLGGVETLVRQFVERDLGSHAAALLDSPGSSVGKGHGLRDGKLACSYLIRHRASRLFSHARHLVFHNFAGMMMLSGTIPHERRTLFLHTNSHDVFALLPLRLPHLDGIITSGEDLAQEVRDRHPDLRIPVAGVEHPLDDRFFEMSDRPTNPVIVIGYSGRLEIEQKQVMRLVNLCAALEARNIPFRLEIAGAGGAASELKSRLPANRYRHLGVLDPDTLRKAYLRWDFIICTSDYETGPLSVMEAMATGCIPLMPDIPCQATRLLEAAGLRRYQPGNPDDAADVLLDISADLQPGEIRSRMRCAVADRRLTGYIATLDSILNNIAELPSLSQPLPIPRGIANFMPFFLRTDPFLGLR